MLRRQGMLGLFSALVISLTGCTSTREYFHNRCKVGPAYCPPMAMVAPKWIDSEDPRVRTSAEDLSHWWTVFKDPVLDALIANAYHQNLSLKQAGFRVLEARALLGVADGNLFPQSQYMAGSYSRRANSLNNPSLPVFGNRFTNQWGYGFNLGWELDFWGKFRRLIEQAEDNLEASVEAYDAVLVTLLGDIANNYVQVRVLQQRIELVKTNVQLQREILRLVQARYDAGRTSELDVVQAKSTLAQTEAAQPTLQITLRQASNRLCTLLGMPPRDLEQLIGTGPIPNAPPEVALNIPAELLLRRPDVRSIERQVAAQSQAIGIAQADFYPHISILGTIGYQTQEFPNLFTPSAFNGSIGPAFQWDILHYGRLLNNVRYQDAKFEELAIQYQATVLQANEEAENGLVAFLRAQESSKFLDESVINAEKAVNFVITQYKVGTVDFNRVATIEQSLVQQQDQAAQARGQIAQGLILLYRALGGGWEIRLEPATEPPPITPSTLPKMETVPIPSIFDPPREPSDAAPSAPAPAPTTDSTTPKSNP